MSTLNVNRIVDSSGGVLAPISSVHRNRIINGAMTIAQRGIAAVTTNGAFPVDRWVQFMSGGGVISGVQDSDVPNSAFQFSTKLTVSTADSSIAAGDFYAFNQSIEGFNATDLGFGTAAASSVTLSFWVKSSVTGTYAVALYNSNGTRGYPATYTISSANTWTFISLTIAGDTGGTWLKDNGAGITIRYDLGTGSNGNGTANTWNTSGTFAASRTSSTVNWISTSGASFYITGVQLEKGTQATSFEYRQYGQELALCQRYYEKSYNTDVVPGTGLAVGWSGTTSQNYLEMPSGIIFKVTKRASPTVTLYNAVSGASGAIYRISDAASVTASADYIGMTQAGRIVPASASANSYWLHWVAAIEL